ncbi:phage regulatory CII family protein [Methylohalobius crimeensis]|uniref:phage regulatory CII family protein n=1 Tax=Methylohalobius crimeensis TaxID=244365 RepID=UPI0003B62E78|nr:phage regulatory CII family protein [Methylohalobius crimeensis]
MDALFIALHQSAIKVKGGISGIARRLGKREHTLLIKLNPNDDLHQPTVGEFVSIMMDTGDLSPLETLCEMFGGQFSTRPQESKQDLPMAVLHSSVEYGDVCRAVEEALADGRLDETEAARLRKEVSEARRALLVLENTVKEQAG